MPMGIDCVLSMAERMHKQRGPGEDNFLDATTLRGKVRDLPYLARHQIYFGHYRFGIHDHLSRPGVYLSLMRAPLERLVSEIKHVTRHAKSMFHPRMASGLGLQELVDSHKGWHFDNLTTRMFAGRVGPALCGACPFRTRGAQCHGALCVCRSSSFVRCLAVGNIRDLAA